VFTFGCGCKWGDFSLSPIASSLEQCHLLKLETPLKEVPNQWAVHLVKLESLKILSHYTLVPLANWTLIIYYCQNMLKFSKIISSKSKNIVKDNSEYLGIFHFLK